MTKGEQLIINKICEEADDKATIEYRAQCDHSKAPRLRSCTAWVYETENYYFLRSYNTIVAFIDKRTDTLYDILRKVWGYSSTSAKHISKFSQDYGAGKWGCENSYRYYDI